MLWIPKVLATGRGPAGDSPRLTGHQILVYLHRLDRADNATGRVTAETTTTDEARTGLKARTLRVADDRLVETGLLTVVRERTNGRPAIYTVLRGTGASRIDLPVAVVWPTDAPDCSPRWGHADAGKALRALLALLARMDHETGRLVGPNGTPWLAEQIHNPAGLSKSDFWAGMSALGVPGTPAGVLRGEAPVRSIGWLTVAPQTKRRRIGEQWVQQPSLVTINWSRLPVQQQVRASLRVVPVPDWETAGIADTEAGTAQIADTGTDQIADTDNSPNRGHGEALKSRTQFSTTSQMLPDSHAPSLPAQGQPTTGTTQPPTTTAGGREHRLEEIHDPSAWAVTAGQEEIDQRLRAEISTAGGRDALADAWWAACVLANLRFASTGYAWRIPRDDAARLGRQLLKHRPGWSALDLAAALSADPTLGIDNWTAVLVHRIGNLPETPTGRDTMPQDVPWLAASPAADPRDGAPQWICDCYAAREAMSAEEWHFNPFAASHPEDRDDRSGWSRPHPSLQYNNLSWDEDLAYRIREHLAAHPEDQADYEAWRARRTPKAPPTSGRRGPVRAVDVRVRQEDLTEEF
ncbi:hypothetical protein ACI79E_00925 [Geodermatophilus sp. SYSU D00079]